MTTKYIHERPEWPHFQWDSGVLDPLLVDIRHRQGRLLGRMEGLGFNLQKEAELEKTQAELETASEAQLSHMEGGKAAKAARQQKAKIKSK